MRAVQPLSIRRFSGGSSSNIGFAIEVDSSNAAYVAGSTTSSDFPHTPGAFQGTLRGSENAFVTKLNASGSALIYSTFLGGNNLTSLPVLRLMRRGMHMSAETLHRRIFQLLRLRSRPPMVVETPTRS